MDTTHTTCHTHPDRLAGVECAVCNRPICPLCMVPAGDRFRCGSCAAGASSTAVTPTSGRSFRQHQELVVFGIQASCSTVWDTINSIDTIRVAGGWERASWDGAEGPGPGRQLVVAPPGAVDDSQSVRWTIERWEPPHVLEVTTPGTRNSYRIQATADGSYLTIGAAWFAPRGRAGWGMRRKMIANLNRFGWTVRDRAEAAG